MIRRRFRQPAAGCPCNTRFNIACNLFRNRWQSSIPALFLHGRLYQTSQLQRGKREQQPSCDLPMAFAGDRLMIDEHRGSDVSKAMKQFQFFLPSVRIDQLLLVSARTTRIDSPLMPNQINGFDKLRIRPSHPPS